MTNSELASIAGAAANTVMFTFSPDPRKIVSAAPVVEAFRKKSIEPEGYVLYAYAAMQLFEQAATQANSVKYQPLRDAMATGRFDTVIGPLSFNAKGDLKVPGLVVYRWKDGAYDVAP